MGLRKAVLPKSPKQLIKRKAKITQNPKKRIEKLSWDAGPGYGDSYSRDFIQHGFRCCRAKK